MVKKLSFITVLLGLSSGLAFAGEPGNAISPPSGDVLTAPETVGMWTVGLEAQLMMPIDKFQYTQAQLVQPDGSVLYHNESEDDEKDWGWEADVAYQFAGTGRDVRFAYTDLNMSDDESYAVPAGTVLYGINGHANPLAITDGGSALGTASYHYRAADLTMGQLLTIGSRVTLHPFAGLRYANINIVGDAKYFYDTGEEDKFSSDSTFSGVGPRAGMDVTVGLGRGFSVVGTVGTSLLLGDLNENYKLSSNIPVNPADYPNTDDTEVFSVIPELDESFGVNYHYAMSQNTAMDAQAGAQVVNYFNADQHDYLGAAYLDSDLANEDFGYHGFYFRVQMSFA